MSRGHLREALTPNVVSSFFAMAGSAGGPREAASPGGGSVRGYIYFQETQILFSLEEAQRIVRRARAWRYLVYI